MGRRWNIGSDDVFIPALILIMFHLISFVALVITLAKLDYAPGVFCSTQMYEFLIGYLIILVMMLFLEILAVIVSCRGSVVNTRPRKFLQHIIYSRLSNKIEL